MAADPLGAGGAMGGPGRAAPLPAAAVYGALLALLTAGFVGLLVGALMVATLWEEARSLLPALL